MPDNVQALLGALQSYAPDGAAQQRCTQMVWEAERDGADKVAVETLLASALSDGLNHGNWPWMQAAPMSYRVADEADIKALLPSDVDKAAYNPDEIDLVFLVDNGTGRIQYGRAVLTGEGTFQMFNVVSMGTWAELVPVGPWKPIEKEDTTSAR